MQPRSHHIAKRRPPSSTCFEPSHLRVSRASAPVRGRGFSLVELLVVLGIIIVLLGLLLPSVVRVRDAARMADCLGTMRQIAMGGSAHALEHDGWYPMAGNLKVAGAMPSDIDDRDQGKYQYFRPPGFPPFMADFQATVAAGLGHKGGLDAHTFELQIQEENKPDGYLRLFYCPSHISQPQDATYAFVYWANGTWSTLRQSYMMNEGFLGWNDSMGRLRGDSKRLSRTDRVMLAADGLPSSPFRAVSGRPFATFVNKVKPSAAAGPITLADAFAGNARAGDPDNFDLKRHRGQMNVCFVDGHAETVRIIPTDLSRVMILP